jgi:hypothetical protein
MLKKNNIPASKINVYVASKEEHDHYLEVLEKGTYNKVVVGKKGIVPQCRFIMNQFPENKHIVRLDDDVVEVDLSLSNLFKDKTLDYFIKYGFKECMKQKSYIWGVYPVYNPFFRKGRDEISTCLNYIVGCFYGIINRPKLNALKLTHTAENGQKEDVEVSLRYFIHDGIVLRFNRVGFVTKYYGTSGGLGRFDERIKTMLEASKRLKAHYGEYGNIVTRKNGMTEFRLRKIPAHTKPGESHEAHSENKTSKKQGKASNKTVKKR